jgi:6-pyruvoyltetrahydropterin/6-carboxytetrahydropterin synthase
MYELKIVSHFAAAHQLRNFGGKCEDLHGHNWKVEVYVSGQKLEDNGLLIDFKIIKDKTNEILERLDHKFINEIEYFKETNPSSENIARYIFDSLTPDINDRNISVNRVTAWESETACATYTGPDSGADTP